MNVELDPNGVTCVTFNSLFVDDVYGKGRYLNE